MPTTGVVYLDQNYPSSNAMLVAITDPEDYTLFVYNQSDWSLGNQSISFALGQSALNNDGTWVNQIEVGTPGVYTVVAIQTGISFIVMPQLTIAEIDTTEVSSINNLNGDVELVAGDNIEIVVSGQNITISASGDVGADFSSITTGTNTSATMTVGSGAAVVPSGSGVVEANEVSGVSVSGTPTTGQVLTATSSSEADWQTPSGGSSTFDEIGSGTNTTAAMVVGTGASLEPTGSGVIEANEISGISVSGTPSTGQILTATSGSAADWQNLPSDIAYTNEANTFTQVQLFSGNVVVDQVLVDGTGSGGTSGQLLSSTVTGTEWVTNSSVSGITISGTPTTGQVLTATSGSAADWQTPSGGALTFDEIESGTNTSATMEVGTGATLEYTGSGVVDANEIGGINVSGNTPSSAGQLLISQPGNTAAMWADPMVQGLFAPGTNVTTGNSGDPINPVLVGGQNPSSELENLNVDSSGNLLVSVASGSGSSVTLAPNNSTTITTLPFTANTSGTNTILAGTSGKVIRVWKLVLFIGGATYITFQDNAGTPNVLMNSAFFPQSSQISWTFDTTPYITVVSGNALVLNNSNAAPLSGILYYTQS